MSAQLALLETTVTSQVKLLLEVNATRASGACLELLKLHLLPPLLKRPVQLQALALTTATVAQALAVAPFAIQALSRIPTILSMLTIAHLKTPLNGQTQSHLRAIIKTSQRWMKATASKATSALLPLAITKVTLKLPTAQTTARKPSIVRQELQLQLTVQLEHSSSTRCSQTASTAQKATTAPIPSAKSTQATSMTFCVPRATGVD